jgi:hypothetical protein
VAPEEDVRRANPGATVQEAEIRHAAKQGNQAQAKMLAKQLVALRQHKQRQMKASGQLATVRTQVTVRGGVGWDGRAVYRSSSGMAMGWFVRSAPKRRCCCWRAQTMQSQATMAKTMGTAAKVRVLSLRLCWENGARKAAGIDLDWAMRGQTMAAANAQLNPQQLAGVMQKFGEESARMDMASEMSQFPRPLHCLAWPGPATPRLGVQCRWKGRFLCCHCHHPPHAFAVAAAAVDDALESALDDPEMEEEGNELVDAVLDEIGLNVGSQVGQPRWARLGPASSSFHRALLLWACCPGVVLSCGLGACPRSYDLHRGLRPPLHGQPKRMTSLPTSWRACSPSRPPCSRLRVCACVRGNM